MHIGLFTRDFWGVFLVVVGLLALLKTYVDIQIPLFRLAVGVLLMWTGVVLLFGGGFRVDAPPGTVIMETRAVEVSDSGEHSTVFGSSVFRVAEPAEGQVHLLKFDSVFSSTEIRVPREAEVQVKASSVFATVRTPDGESVSFGEHTYATAGAPRRGVKPDNADSLIIIEINAVFSSVTVVRE